MECKLLFPLRCDICSVKTLISNLAFSSAFPALCRDQLSFNCSICLVTYHEDTKEKVQRLFVVFFLSLHPQLFRPFSANVAVLDFLMRSRRSHYLFLSKFESEWLAEQYVCHATTLRVTRIRIYKSFLKVISWSGIRPQLFPIKRQTDLSVCNIWNPHIPHLSVSHALSLPRSRKATFICQDVSTRYCFDDVPGLYDPEPQPTSCGMSGMGKVTTPFPFFAEFNVEHAEPTGSINTASKALSKTGYFICFWKGNVSEPHQEFIKVMQTLPEQQRKNNYFWSKLTSK